MSTIQRFLSAGTDARSVLLVRIAVGLIFLSEGIQKFLFPQELGIGRFQDIGIPAPGFMASFVGIVEIVCGALSLFGFLTRLAAIPLIIDMLTSIITTKIPLLAQSGIWPMAHEARTDFAMLLGSSFLLVFGAGAWSVDRFLTKRHKPLNTSAYRSQVSK